MTPKSVLVDPEQVRILRALGYGPQTLAYAVAQQMTRVGDGSGKVDEAALLDMLSACGVRTSAKGIRRWIKSGDGVLWHWDRAHRKIYLYKPIAYGALGLKGRLNATQLALAAGRPELVTTNPPGTRLVEVHVASTLKAWYGNLLSAWHNSRGEHTYNISRYTLSILFGASRHTLISWERAAGIHVIESYKQSVDWNDVPTAHAYPYITSSNDVRWRWRHSNEYDVPVMTIRSHTRLPRERRRGALLTLEISNGNQPVAVLPNGFLDSPRRITFRDRQTAKKQTSAFQALRRHRKRHPNENIALCARLGRDKFGRVIYEQTELDHARTQVHEPLSRAVADEWFARHGGRGGYVLALQMNGGIE